MPEHDLIIRGAMLYDGSGEPPRQADLAVADGRISGVGANLGDATETIDADGLALAPGIIDVHTHYDAQLTWDPWANPSPGLGVTTVLIGNCGFTIAPCKPPHRDLTARNLCNVEGMSIEALRAGIDWDFVSFDEYLSSLERRGVGPNVACFVGHSSLRTWVMGDGATKRAATDDEVAQMAELVRDGMAAGGVGFATSTFEGHNGEGGVPMPSLSAEESEILALTKAMGERGRGVFMLTKGGDTSIDFLETLGIESRRPIMIAALIQNSVTPERIFSELGQIAAANGRGNELYGQVSCTPVTMEFTLRNPYLMEAYKAWRPVMEAPAEAVPGLYADPAFRAAMKAELEDQTKLRVFNGDWSRIEINQAALPENKCLEGRNVAALAADSGKHPLDWLLDFGATENLDTFFSSTLLNSDEDAVGRVIADPYSTLGLGDAGAHLTFFCDAGFGLHLYGHWVRERGALSLEEAVHATTARQADIFRIPLRGRLVEGHWADLMLFDPATINRTPNRRVNDLPADASRLTCGAVGLEGVWVNGARVAGREGMVTNGAGLPGRVLREFGA
jgi:N-acyl-D-aspartate/D-glutamate deacylase